MFRNVTRISLE